MNAHTDLAAALRAMAQTLPASLFRATIASKILATLTSGE